MGRKLLEIDEEMIGVYSFPKGIKSILGSRKFPYCPKMEKIIFHNNNDDYD